MSSTLPTKRSRMVAIGLVPICGCGTGGRSGGPLAQRGASRALSLLGPAYKIEPRFGVSGAKFREETPTEASCQRSNLIRKRICVTTPHKQRGRQLECGAKLGNSPERSPSSLPMPSRQIHQDAWLLCLRVGHRRRMDLTRCAVFVAFLAQPECSSTSPAPLTSATLRGA